uniref:Arf-GAP domain-containing protein n=2 Tax=Haptolina brevifila TaxID=156173 RepID=A0A7S2ISK3_9EUKA
MAPVGEIGMPCSNHKTTPKEQQESERRLRTIVVGDNAVCADCRLPIQFRNAWASINLGAYLCIQCSGVHRSLGVHLSKVRAVAADDWNSDWVDNMERWGNTRATAFWEAKPPQQRPEATQGATSASRPMVDFIRAKYAERVFAAEGVEPGDWLLYAPLANGWARHFDEESKSFYFSNGTETTWEVPLHAQLPPSESPLWWSGNEGWLEKKSGGHDGQSKMKLMQKWDKRFFVLDKCGTVLKYYKSDEAFRKREEPAGMVELRGASVFVKEAKGDLVRFTLLAPDRQLKLRAPMAEYRMWASALRPLVGDVTDGPAAMSDDD